MHGKKTIYRTRQDCHSNTAIHRTRQECHTQYTAILPAKHMQNKARLPHTVHGNIHSTRQECQQHTCKTRQDCHTQYTARLPYTRRRTHTHIHNLQLPSYCGNCCILMIGEIAVRTHTLNYGKMLPRHYPNKPRSGQGLPMLCISCGI